MFVIFLPIHTQPWTMSATNAVLLTVLLCSLTHGGSLASRSTWKSERRLQWAYKEMPLLSPPPSPPTVRRYTAKTGYVNYVCLWHYLRNPWNPLKDHSNWVRTYIPSNPLFKCNCNPWEEPHMGQNTHRHGGMRGCALWKSRPGDGFSQREGNFRTRDPDWVRGGLGKGSRWRLWAARGQQGGWGMREKGHKRSGRGGKVEANVTYFTICQNSDMEEESIFFPSIPISTSTQKG